MGEIEGNGFGIGVAGAKGTQRVVAGAILQKSKKKTEADDTEEKDSNIYIDQTSNNPSLRERKLGGATLSRAEEFESFKKGKGAEMASILSENKCNFIIM